VIKTNRLRVLTITKDGGPESRVWAYWLFSYKPWFGIVLLRFEDGSRDAYHEHAFNCVSWVLKGKLRERTLLPKHDGRGFLGALLTDYAASWRPVITRRDTLHKVTSVGRTWVLSFRGPWADTWREWLPQPGRFITLTHGRRVLRAVDGEPAERVR
jgi:hypothetical protein